MSLPAIPRLAGLAAVVGVAALALFFFGPMLLGFGADDDGAASPTPTASPTRSIAPTPTPAPTPVVYIIKPGDTLSKIATAHGTTVDAILAANPTITDPNKIIVGNQITIPAPSPEIPDEFGGSPGASAEPSP